MLHCRRTSPAWSAGPSSCRTRAATGRFAITVYAIALSVASMWGTQGVLTSCVIATSGEAGVDMNARLRQALNKRYRWSDGVKTLQAHIDDLGAIRLTFDVQWRYQHKTNGWYPPLTHPKPQYSVWSLDDRGQKHRGWDVPKIVAEYYSEQHGIPIEPFNEDAQRYLADPSYRPDHWEDAMRDKSTFG